MKRKNIRQVLFVAILWMAYMISGSDSANAGGNYDTQSECETACSGIGKCECVGCGIVGDAAAFADVFYTCSANAVGNYDTQSECETACSGIGKCECVGCGIVGDAAAFADVFYTCKPDVPATTTATAAAGATTPAGTTQRNVSTEFENPLRFNSIEEFLGHFLGFMRNIIVMLALIAIVFGALMYVTSAGNPGQTEKAKKAIMAAIIGVAIGIAAPSFLKEVALILGWGETGSAIVDSAPTFMQIALSVLNFLLGILGILALIMMVIGSYFYLASGGNQGQVDTGKKIFKYALLGVVIAMSSMVLVRQVMEILLPR